MQFVTAIRPPVLRRLERIGRADLVIGVPCFNNQETIGHVIRTLAAGAKKDFPDAKTVLVIADGGSTDDTREVAAEEEIDPFIEKIVAPYRGIGGKGSAFRMIFEIVGHLQAPTCVVCDSDLRSITPEWLQALARPVLEHDFDFVAPLYSRYKYDATITNNFAYNLTQALFGKQIRQPIGGDFGFSLRFARHCQQQDVWVSDVARFGVDIWMTLTAIMENFKICQSYLGAKIHDAKDPASSLGPMFRQVLLTLFTLMELYYPVWSKITRSEAVPLFGSEDEQEPEAFEVDVDRMIENFKQGYQHFEPLWRTVVNPETFQVLTRNYQADREDFYLTTEEWAKIVYDFAATFHQWKRDRARLIDLMTPLYYARAASFVIRTREMTHREAEEVVREQAFTFERMKPYLLERWAEADRMVEREVGAAEG